MVFQEPMSSLNPVFTIGDQIGETLRAHERLGPAARRTRTMALLDRVGIPSAARRLDDYPHQMSGGQRQRVMIAIALACNPRLLIADEPTTALDVTIQAQILDLLLELRAERGMAVMLITHNMGVVAETADRVLVMYSGRIVEQSPVATLFDHPAHPYTAGLLACVPSLEMDLHRLQRHPRQRCPTRRAAPPAAASPRAARSTSTECDAAMPPAAAGRRRARGRLHSGRHMTPAGRNPRPVAPLRRVRMGGLFRRRYRTATRGRRGEPADRTGRDAGPGG